jgi:hypothetical protein
MSGIEIAGLVLGSISLAIAGLDHYEAGKTKVKIFRRWRDYLAKTRRTLLSLHGSFKITMRLALTPFASEDEILEMLTYPTSALWQSPHIVDCLRSSLFEGYDRYLDLITEMEDIMVEVIGHLDLRPDSNVRSQRFTLIHASLSSPYIPALPHSGSTTFFSTP